MIWISFILLAAGVCDFASGNLIDELYGRAKRASEGIVTDFGGKITINNLPGEERMDGKRCINKTVNVEETVFDHAMNCEHKLKTKCHLTYITDYHSTPEKKCETNFIKDCRITFKSVPHVEKVQVCRIPYEKKCGEGIVGPEVCKHVYETICETTFKEYDIEEDHPNCKVKEEVKCEKVPIDLLHLPHKEGQMPFAEKERCEKWPVQTCDLEQKTVKKIHPETECKKMGRRVCAPNNCDIVPGEKICNDVTRTLVQNVPEEECDLQPQESCRMESTLVPRLVPKKNCIKVPKEICVSSKKNPRKQVKPIVKLWCYDPTELTKETE